MTDDRNGKGEPKGSPAIPTHGAPSRAHRLTCGCIVEIICRTPWCASVRPCAAHALDIPEEHRARYEAEVTR